jgi:hypothetical protein
MSERRRHRALAIASWTILLTIAVGGLIASYASGLATIPPWLTRSLGATGSIFGIAALIAWVSSIVLVWTRSGHTRNRGLLLLILVGTFPGALIYYFLGPVPAPAVSNPSD